MTALVYHWSFFKAKHRAHGAALPRFSLDALCRYTIGPFSKQRGISKSCSPGIESFAEETRSGGVLALASFAGDSITKPNYFPMILAWNLKLNKLFLNRN